MPQKAWLSPTHKLYTYAYVYLHISVHAELQCMSHVAAKDTYISTALQPHIPLKKCCISSMHLFIHHEELVHRCCTQKGFHEQASLLYYQIQS